MLRLTVICPPDLTEEVLALLRSNPGATHVIISRNAALDPEGDVVWADLAREAANEIVQILTEQGIGQLGAITLDNLDTTISKVARQAEKEADGDPGDAIIWEELLARTREESTLNFTFVAFLALACLIAAVGVVTDSPVTVVGAMVVGPEFGPLAALSVAIVRKRVDLARRASIALLVGFPLAMVITAVGALAAESVGWVTLESVSALTQVDFIYQVGPFSLVVALLAGAAGMLSLMSAKSAALVGVFISVTTVPAAGFAVVAATIGQWGIAVESAIQLAVNLAGIVFAGIIVLLLRRATWRHSGKSNLARAR
ncbi:MAG: DUF389 domain-containing protein [Mycobacteriaceae bacterium]